ncbi:hypothetical protein JYG30_06225 [Fibrella sp. USSR17]
MDARKIQFLIGIQREIDKLEAKEGNVPKVEKIKSRFYDVVEVDEIVGAPKNETDSRKESEELTQSTDNKNPDVTDLTQYADLFDIVDGLSKEDFLNAEQAEEVIKKLQKNETSSKITRGVENEIVIKGRRSVNAGVRKNIPQILDEKTKNIEKSFPHKPKDVVEFMKLFDDASSLKYLTHDYDEVEQKFDIHKFIGEAEKIFKQYTYKYTIPPSLWKLINQFAFEKTPKWFSAGQEIEEGWSSKKWIKWSETHGFPSKNVSFESIIKEFKNQVRVRALPKIIQRAIDKKFGDQQNSFNFNFIELEKADFYTHADSFTAGLEHLFDEICNRSEFPNVTIKLQRGIEGDYRQRIIHIQHHDSYPSNKSIDEVFEKYKSSGGNLWEVRRKLFGYCHWYIETIWDEQPTRIYLLRDGMVLNKVDVEIERLESIAYPGFTHTLTFYTR